MRQLRYVLATIGLGRCTSIMPPLTATAGAAAVSNVAPNQASSSMRLAPELRCVAAATLRPPPAVLPAWRAELTSLVQQVEAWPEVARLVQRHQVGGLVYGALAGLPATAGVPRQLLEDLAAAARRARLAALLKLGETRRVGEAFQRAGIPAVQLKGAPLSERLYGDALLRQSMDTDVLVPPARLLEAVAVLQRLGYTTDEHIPSEPGLRSRLQRRAYHHCMLRNHMKMPLELHWRLSSYSESQTDRLVAQSSPTSAGLGVLPVSAELVYLIAHGTRHYWARLKWLSDIKQALLCAPPSAWSSFSAECAAVGVQHAVEVTRCVLEAVFAIPSLQLPSSMPARDRHWRCARYALYRMQAALQPEAGIRSVLAKTRYRLGCATHDEKFAVALRCADLVRGLAHHS